MCTTFFSWEGWQALEAIGTVGAAGIALKSIRTLEKQLRIEQEPLVVAHDFIEGNGGGLYIIKIKNAGRGPALNITPSRSRDPKEKDRAFLPNDQPHSKDFSPKENSTWKVEKNVLDRLDEVENGAYKLLFLFYENQMGTQYRTEVKLKEIPHRHLFVVMHNKMTKL